MSYPCPKGHQSTDADYCSECGLKLGAAAPSSPPPSSECPSCGTPRVGGARFCEVCRYDFSIGEAAAPLAPPPPPPAPPPAVAASPAAIAKPWAVVVADRALMGADADGLHFPDDEPKRSYPLDLDENLVGRRAARAGVHPEIPINDPSVSSRHLKICRRPDGALYLVDVGSSNGSKLNGAAVTPGVEMALKAGDEILIGAWTRIVIEAR